jgi:hypothetical protein
MHADPLPSEPAEDPASMVQDAIHHDLRPKMRVLGKQGVSLGRIDSIELDSSSGRPTVLLIRHGLLGRKRTRVPANRITNVSEHFVSLAFSDDDFNRLPLVVSQ